VAAAPDPYAHWSPAGLSFEWVHRCARLLLPHVETGEGEALARDIDAIAGYLSRSVSRKEIQERAIEIWYDTPQRDAARTAVSHLYSALACPFEEGGIRHSIAMCVPIVSFLQGSARPVELHEMVLADFREFAEANGLSIDEEDRGKKG
jgi:hypothetical protein